MAKARYQHRHGSKANLSASDVLPDESVIVDSGDTPSSSAMYYKPSGGGLVRLANYSDVKNSDSMLLMNSVPQSVSDWKRGQIGWVNSKPVIKTGVGSETTTVPLALESSVDSKIANKADKATTLAGYGITDAENRGNKVTSISQSSTDAQYPSAKLLYDSLIAKENINNKVTSISQSSTDAQYPSAKLLYTSLASKPDIVHVTLKTDSAQFPHVDTAIDPNTIYRCHNSLDGDTGWLFFNGNAGFARGTEVSQILFDRAGDIMYRIGKSNGDWQTIDWSEAEWKTFAKSTDLANKADKATTLAGYGITDAYSTTDSDNRYEQSSRKVTSLSSSSTDTQYPSAKLVYDSLLSKANFKVVQENPPEGSNYDDVDAATDTDTIYTLLNSNGGVKGLLVFSGSRGFVNVGVSQVRINLNGIIEYRVGIARGWATPIDWSGSSWTKFETTANKVTDLNQTFANHNSYPSAKAVKAYIDAAINNLQ